MKVVIAGSGNVATVLGRKILAAGNEIIEIVGRNRESTLALAALLKSSANYDSRTVNCNADIYIICVSDGSIAEVASGLKLNDKIVVHAAAAVSKEVLRSCGKNYGVLYPLQTLRKELETVPPIPVLIDGNNVHTKKV
ncbi:MAG TPA: NAD(P)-binding domain-containing protein, partial [Segetibacter sp.]